MLYIHRSAASDSSTSTHRPPLVTFIKSHVNDTRLLRSHPKRLNTQPTGLSLLLLCLCVQEAFRSVSQPPAQLSSCRAVCLWYFLEIHWGANAIRQYEVNIYEVRQWRSQRLDAIMRALNYKKKTDQRWAAVLTHHCDWPGAVSPHPPVFILAHHQQGQTHLILSNMKILITAGFRSDERKKNPQTVWWCSAGLRDHVSWCQSLTVTER